MLWPRLFGDVLKLKSWRVFRWFRKACRSLPETQERVLLRKIRRNEDSRFGRQYRFDAIHSVDDFRRALPLTDYGTYEPWIEHLKRGDLRACFGPAEALLMFALTSGTYARPKYIPVTKSFLDEYRLGWHVWGYGVVRWDRAALDYHILRVVSPSVESTTEGGIPCGSISGLMTESLPGIIRQRYTPPAEVSTVRSARGKYYLAGRIAVAHKVSLVSTANPSSVLAVVRAIDENRESVVRDIHDGTVDRVFEIPDDLKRRLGRDLRPRRKRAKFLEDILSRTGRLLPKDYWPELRLLGNWKGGSCGVYLDRYPEYFARLPVRDIGLLASEGRMSIPLANEGAAGPLDVTSHFFEFIPEDEIPMNRDPTVLLAHELQVGGRYGVVLTTSSGFYRYNIMDVVRVTGFFERTPEVEFLNKGHYFSSLTGEKVSEFQVVESMKQAGIGLKGGPEDGTFSPMQDDPPRYSLAVERPTPTGWDRHSCLSGQADKNVCPTRLHEFLTRFEEHLRSMNIEYDRKRDSGRLGAPVLHVLRPGAFDDMKEERLAEMGGRREQYKHRFLVSELDYYRKLPVEETIVLEAERGGACPPPSGGRDGVRARTAGVREPGPSPRPSP